MVHFYLGAKTLGLGSRPPEEYDLTKCVRFPQELSLRNPQNYQALVAMVEQRCFDTPVSCHLLFLSELPFKLPHFCLFCTCFFGRGPGVIGAYT